MIQAACDYVVDVVTKSGLPPTDPVYLLKTEEDGRVYCQACGAEWKPVKEEESHG